MSTEPRYNINEHTPVDEILDLAQYIVLNVLEDDLMERIDDMGSGRVAYTKGEGIYLAERLQEVAEKASVLAPKVMHLYA